MLVDALGIEGAAGGMEPPLLAMDALEIEGAPGGSEGRLAVDALGTTRVTPCSVSSLARRPAWTAGISLVRTRTGGARIALSSASNIAAALGQRFAGDFSSARVTTASSAGGTPSSLAMGGTGAVRTAITTSLGAPTKGSVPASIRWSTTPAAHRSVRASVGAPRSCSGDM